jgi:hypothetical protein
MKKTIVIGIFALALSLRAQETVPPASDPAAPPPDSPPAVATAAPPPPRENRADRDMFPNINLYLPEGEVDLRARKLIRNVLFESQINYQFVDGDISTFLRYKYYARDFTYRFSVFDTIEFASVQSGSRDFDRVRGGLLLFEFPANYNQRYFFLSQIDGLTFSDVRRRDNNQNNLYFKLAYQQGTPFDERLNGIVGESRGRISPVLTAFRDIGPQKIGLAVALTQGINKIAGDYRYTKFESELLKRSDLTENIFLISRVHAGTIVNKQRMPLDVDENGNEIERTYFEHYSVPRYELFRIGGREALKGIDSNSRGDQEVHLSNEVFAPIFRNRNYRIFGSHWTNMYGIGYVGVGACRCDSGRNVKPEDEVLSNMSDFVADAGLGIESSITVRDYDVFLSVLYAQTVNAPDNLKGHEIRFSIRTSR